MSLLTPFRERRTQFYVELLYGALFIAGFAYLVFRFDPRVAAFEGGLVVGYLLRVWEKMSIYERVIEETVSEAAEAQVETEVERQVSDEVAAEVEQQVDAAVDDRIDDRVEQQVGELREEVDGRIEELAERDAVENGQ
ncbi:hypothetical protein [Haloarcula litorea]|uniref:hypothetical protein n=1 Tax=Haloarcula litorea TaxID=3032579 RepID=UPI0023E7E0F8|nr:hypothetical protein [Halomicroarcula sp. GDY20]